eukprot:SAG22_NODE_8611_length_641_cov_1.424354_1_plen_180_part_10
MIDPRAAMVQTIHAALERQATARPDASALIDGQLTLSFGQLDQAAEALAAEQIRPRHRCADPPPPIGISCEPCAGAVVAVLAVLKASECYLPLDPHYPPGRLQFYVEDAEVSLIVATGPGGFEVGEGWYAGNVILIDSAGSCGSPMPGVAAADPAGTLLAGPRAAAGDAGLAYVVYTSGS